MEVSFESGDAVAGQHDAGRAAGHHLNPAVRMQGGLLAKEIVNLAPDVIRPTRVGEPP